MDQIPDHQEFIERQHRQVIKEPVKKKASPFCRVLTFVWAVLSLAFAFFFIALSYEVYSLRTEPLHSLFELIFIWLVSFLALSVFFRKARYALLNKNKTYDVEILDAVLEGSRGARLITDQADNAVYYNRRFEKLCEGFGRPDLDALSQLFKQNDQARTHFAALADSAHRGVEGAIDLPTTYEGQDQWFLVTAQPVQNWPGYIHWRIDNETETYTARQAKDEEREKLIDFTDNAPVGFFSVNQKGRFVFANATFARWLGVDLDTLLNDVVLHSFLETVPEDAFPYDVIEGGGARQVAEVNLKGPGGKVFKASISQTVVVHDDKTVRTRAVVHDISAESAMRHALKQSEDRFARFFEEAPLGIVMIDPDHTIQESNKAFLELTGHKSAKVHGESFFSLLHEDDHDEVRRHLSRVGSCDDVEALGEVRLRKAGTDNNDNSEDNFVFSVIYGRHFESLSGNDNIVLHFLDTSEKKSLEQQFAQSQKMQAVGQLAGGVAHDFNNLLTAIIGFCDLLLLRHKPGDPSFQDIMQIKQNSNRASNLVRQLLAFSRQQTLRPKVQDITDILTEVSHLVRRLLGANVELEITHGENLGLVKVDGGQMEQVIMNMAVNARDAMDGAGQLRIETEHFSNKQVVAFGDDEMAPGHWVKISISDTGTGITPENLERIFEPFFTTKDVGKGTGLGLATVYGIIRQTGGFLDVESVVGEGTTFIVYLPVAQNIEEDDDDFDDIEDNIVEEAPKPKDLTGTAKILLVEDEDAVRNFSERALGNKGYNVVGADCGESAVEVIEEHGVDSFDLVITDVIMPNMDGPTLANKIREQSPKMKIIFVSGYTEEKLKEHMGENIFFLPKPFSLKQLAEKVKEVLG